MSDRPMINDEDTPSDVDTSYFSESQIEELHQEYTAIARGYGDRVSVVCEGVNGEWDIEVNSDYSRPCASMIKLVVLGAFLEEVSSGTYSLDDAIVLDASQIVSGTGVIQNNGAGSSWTYRELAELMITDSDNIAANILIDTIGFDNVNEYATRVGLTGTQLNRKMMDSNAINAGIENKMSAKDISTILIMIYQKTFVNSDMSDFALQALENQHIASGVSRMLPKDIVFAHKTGTLSRVEHDGGLVLSDYPFTLVVMTENMSKAESNACMADLVSATCDILL